MPNLITSPAMIICGGSAYPRDWDYEGFRKIADDNGSLLMCDMAHISGLVATKEHSDILFYTLNVQASELAGALLASNRIEHNEQHANAFSAFISKFSTNEIETAMQEISANEIKIIDVLK